MTVQVGTHVHPVADPEADLVVDAVAPQGSGHTLLRVHDARAHYVTADEVETGGRHELDETVFNPAWAPRILTANRIVFGSDAPHRHTAPEATG